MAEVAAAAAEVAVGVGVGVGVGTLLSWTAEVGDGDDEVSDVAGFGATFTGTAEGVTEAALVEAAVVVATPVPLAEG